MPASSRAEVVQTKGKSGVLATLAAAELDAFNEFPHVIVITDVHEANCSRLGAKNEAELQTNATFKIVCS